MHVQLRPVRAVGVMASLAILAIAISVALLLWNMRQRELEHARLETISITHMFMEETEQIFERTDLLLRIVQERLQNEYGSQFGLDSLPTHLLLGARVSGVRQLSGMFLADASGQLINGTREYPVKATSVADQQYFRFFADGGASKQDVLFTDTPVRNLLDRGWSLNLARRINDRDGKFRGVVVAVIDIAQLEQFYSQIKLEYVRPMAIYMSDGKLVASAPHRENMTGERAPELGATLPELPEREVVMVERVSGDGERQVFALGRVARFPLLVAVTNDEDWALASWRESAIPIALGAVLVAVSIVLVAMLLSREVRREEALTRALDEANDRHHQTVNSLMDAIVATDTNATIVLFNPAAERMFGRAASDAIGRPLVDLMPVRSRAIHAQHLQSFARSNARARAMAPGFDITGLRADGSEFPIETTISHTIVDGKPQLTAVLRDVTERRRAEAELRQMNSQLRELSASLQDVREQERTRISRELHDELGQQLTGLKLELSWLGNRLKDGRDTPPDRIDDMRRQLDAAISSVRRISTELRPPILDELGFAEAVSWQTEEFARRSGVKVILEQPAASRITSDALATALFRIVQESLTNIARHAGATRVDIRLVIDEQHLVLTVKDDGRGLTDDDGPVRGIGLISMRERATALGGRLDVISEAGKGTLIKVAIALDAPVLASSMPTTVGTA